MATSATGHGWEFPRVTLPLPLLQQCPRKPRVIGRPRDAVETAGTKKKKKNKKDTGETVRRNAF